MNGDTAQAVTNARGELLLRISPTFRTALSLSYLPASHPDRLFPWRISVHYSIFNHQRHGYSTHSLRDGADYHCIGLIIINPKRKYQLNLSLDSFILRYDTDVVHFQHRGNSRSNPPIQRYEDGGHALRQYPVPQSYKKKKNPATPPTSRSKARNSKGRKRLVLDHRFPQKLLIPVPVNHQITGDTGECGRRTSIPQLIRSKIFLPHGFIWRRTTITIIFPLNPAEPQGLTRH
ncbi:hypothetical protein BDM02DRAFT_1730291 [Thelephora ganbajun]|uniref:Uncharacterized protein n=1 Tax=Thelephora ganbajun TaxID=370292 RepID=A0ACB6ZK99_THEGA|nr:hypothetical protein BDM02DRAFT_1730291 [Thelephora ganbajun]